MRPSRFFLAVATVAASAAASMAPAAEHPYAGLDQRSIKALSDDEISALRTGLGYSQALSAELNGYPGPRHAIDLADRLQLSVAQRAALGALFASMQAEAIVAGEAVLAAEANFDRAFASGQITEQQIAAAAEEIGRLRGVLRGIHLRYHLRTQALLSPHQVALYATARGYAGGAHDMHGGNPAHDMGAMPNATP